MVGAICNIVGYYGIGFPIGVPLMFAAKLGIKGKVSSWDCGNVWVRNQSSIYLNQISKQLSKMTDVFIYFPGLWTGLFICVSLQCAFLIFYLVKMNWKTATVEVRV